MYSTYCFRFISLIIFWLFFRWSSSEFALHVLQLWGQTTARKFQPHLPPENKKTCEWTKVSQKSSKVHNSKHYQLDIWVQLLWLFGQMKMTLFSRDIFTEMPAVRRLVCLFNDAVSGSAYATLNGKMSKEWKTKGTTKLISLAIVHELSYNFAFVIHSSFKNFPEFAGIIYRSCCMREISAHWHPSSP